MRIGGFVKQSFIDWPGRLVAVIFTKGCNFRCFYCHNPSLVLPELFNAEEDIQEGPILKALETRKGWLEGVVISGGEPTLQQKLPDFLRKIKAMGLRVKLDTNGSNPDMLEKLIKEDLLDFVAMDIKSLPDIESYESIIGAFSPGLIGKINQSIQILKSASIPVRFRTTVLPGIHHKEIIEKLQNSFGACEYILQKYREGDNLECYADNRPIKNSEI